MHKEDYMPNPSPEELRAIRTVPGLTAENRPFDWYVRRKVQRGEWRLQCVDAEVLGLCRPLEVYRASRTANFVKPWPQTNDAEVYCPAS